MLGRTGDYTHLWVKLFSLPDTLAPQFPEDVNVSVTGDRVFRGVIRLKWGPNPK